ncbi:MAG: DUF3857 domain-containing protein [Candidatus Azobacteroides sp.]|nr:DUF3857 domain-containing protein [Candidatus Azobacteroides sp.]
MKKYLFIALLGIFTGRLVVAQDYPVLLIPDSLTKNANTVIRNYNINFIQNDVNDGISKISKTITILNSKGKNDAMIYILQDKFHELTDFSCTIRNSEGMILKKVKKGDLTTSSFSESFASDDKYSFYECQAPSYPFTIEYNYQIKYKNGIIGYPVFDPINNYARSVETANYQIEIPSNMTIRYKVSNYDNPIDSLVTNNKKIYTCNIAGLKAQNEEPLSPPITEYVPYVIFGPTNFCYDGFCGNMSDWNSYGKWIFQLLAERDQLSPDFKEKIRSLTENAKSDKEKAKILYEYLQANMRYVSIQLGIGGFRPASASDVQRTGFGDCKGLSNMMKAMLNAVNIPSIYTVIRMDEKEKRIYTDFPNFIQFNHVILCVPFKNDSLWLECTSKTTPFGYIHNGISGHDALLITENGGKLCRLPSYPDSLNKSVSNLNIILTEDGTATGKVSYNYYLDQYESSVHTFETNDPQKQNDYLTKSMKSGKVKILNIHSNINKSADPEIKIDYDFIAEDFANRSSNRLFFPICPIKKIDYNIFSSSKREHDIKINNGYNDSDSINIQIPEGYSPESLPNDITVTTPYGIYISKIKYEDGKLKHFQNIQIFRKRHSKDDYKNIKTFFEKINESINRSVVIKKI